MEPDDVSQPELCDVAIVGGGTAGLALGAELKRQGVEKVVILEREQEAGGIPRHCGHFPFGLREYGRLQKGPDYARRNVAEAERLGVDIRAGITVTKLLPDAELETSSDDGPGRIKAQRVVLATGVREASRAQRFIGGDRPGGVISTAALQGMAYLKHIKPFERPVILGSELVSFSAINTCRHLGIKPVAMLEEQDRIIAQELFRLYLYLNGIALHAGVTQPRIVGGERVEALDFVDRHGNKQRIECDGVIMSGRFRPEAALLNASHVAVDPGSGGPSIDQYGRCSDPSYYSAGNLLRPVETSGFCWREGVVTAKRIAADLAGQLGAGEGFLRLRSADPALHFVLPQRLSRAELDSGMGGKMQLAVHEPVNGRLVALEQGREIWSARIKSRQGRRIQYDLEGICRARPDHDVDLVIRRSMDGGSP